MTPADPPIGIDAKPPPPEQGEIRGFLAATPPFDRLPAEVLDAAASTVTIVRMEADSLVLKPRQAVNSLYLVRSGRIQLCGPAGAVWAERVRGQTFGLRALLSDGFAMFHAIALEDSTLYLLPAPVFARLKLEHREIDRFFTPVGGAGRSLSHADDRPSAEYQSNLIALRVRDLMSADPVTIEADRPVREAARLMRECRISCLPVTKAGALAGIITNVDLRDRVVAEGIPADTAVEAVMSREPLTLPAERLAYDALLAMRQRIVRHLPVTDGGRLVGVITNTDTLRRQISNPGYLSGIILRRPTVASLAEVVAQVPQLLVVLVETGVSAHRIGLIVTTVADVTTYRLLQLAEDRLGPPPVPYVWVANGSQARQEQAGISDQDNCIILDDRFHPGEHGRYFEDLARFVCDGLNACGYVYCPGDMMALTPRWRQPLAQWKRYFNAWIDEPEPEARMLASVMFDLRPIRGETRLFDELQREIGDRAQANSMFVAHMAGNALTHIPPLGALRQFVLSRGGDHAHMLDLKLQGTVPIIDIARIHALRAGIRTANTRDRLIEAHKINVVSEGGMHDLIDAFEFLSIVRLKHQSRQIRLGQRPDNFLSPKELSRIERQHLRDAFIIVRTMQTNLASAYQVRR
ncbi:MAG: cyclic nucleotide-binding/CBS domain-containing protein [Rhodospirillales bacterium]|nr:cyclic nucleotide-binding/CBS domain-containing protein [Rhodospirillales bacterium]